MAKLFKDEALSFFLPKKYIFKKEEYIGLN